jgi:hypothetical protein
MRKSVAARSHFSLDELGAENRYLLEPAHDVTAKKMFDQRWAITVLDQAMIRLREECSSNNKADLCSKLECFLSGERGEVSYAQVATELGMGEGAIKMAVLRLRRRYSELIRAEIAQTVTTPQEADEELQFLFTVLRD